jgi:hypothetical protein
MEKSASLSAFIKQGSIPVRLAEDGNQIASHCSVFKICMQVPPAHETGKELS